MSSQRYINAASEYKYICILIYNAFCSATFYNDPPMITHAVAQELGPQGVSRSSRCFPFFTEDFGSAHYTYGLMTEHTLTLHTGANRTLNHFDEPLVTRSNMRHESNPYLCMHAIFAGDSE